MQLSLLRDVETREKKAVNVPRTSVEAYQRTHKHTRMADVTLWLSEHIKTRQQYPTSAELARLWGPAPYWDGKYIPILYVRRGLSDALQKGLVEHAGKRTCTVAGSSALTWKVRSR